jgi:hypothetical protein
MIELIAGRNAGQGSPELFSAVLASPA